MTVSMNYAGVISVSLFIYMTCRYMLKLREQGWLGN